MQFTAMDTDHETREREQWLWNINISANPNLQSLSRVNIRMHSGLLSPRHLEMLNSAKPSIVYIYKWFTSLCRASIYLRFLQKILSNYSFLCHPLVIKFADAEKTKEQCRAVSKINWAVMMGTISWRLTHSVTPRLRTIIYVSSKILSVFFITLSETLAFIHSLSLSFSRLSSIISLYISLSPWWCGTGIRRIIRVMMWVFFPSYITHGPEEMTIENTTKDMFKVRGLDCIYSRAM